MSSRSQPGRLVSAQSSNFYYSFLFLPRAKRRAIESVYSFARRGDDLADGDLAPEEATREIIRYRHALDECYAGQGSTEELRVLAETVRLYNIPRRHFDDLILGLEMDLRGTRYETFDDLALYCQRVASTIGLIAIDIFGYRNPRTRDYAVNLGIALQLVNILRDLQSDARRGRIYLPRQDLDRYAVRPADLAEGRAHDSLVKLMRFECNRARGFFNLAGQMLSPEDRPSMTAAETMAAIYWHLLKRIERRAYKVFGDRISLSLPLKFWIALSVYLGAEWQK
jgi:phytoene synthase